MYDIKDYLSKKDDVIRQACTDLTDIENYQVKLIDYGFCRLLGDEGPLTVGIGAPTIMAPELIRELQDKKTEGVYDQKVDVWGLGIAFIMLLTQQTVNLFPSFGKKAQRDFFILTK